MRTVLAVFVLCLSPLTLRAQPAPGELPEPVRPLRSEDQRRWVAAADDIRRVTYLKDGRLELLPRDMASAFAEIEERLRETGAKRILEIDRELAEIKKKVEDLRMGPTEGINARGAKRRPLNDRKAQLERERRELMRDSRQGAPIVRPSLAAPLTLEKGAVGHVKTVRVISIEGPLEMLVQLGNGQVWVRGMPTDGLVDSREVVVDRGMRITGTKRDRGRTVFLAEPFDVRPYLRVPTYKDVAAAVAKAGVPAAELPGRVADAGGGPAFLAALPGGVAVAPPPMAKAPDHGGNVAKAIAERRLIKGMTVEQAKQSLGTPAVTNEGADELRLEWAAPNRQTGRVDGTRRVWATFADGILNDFQDTRRGE